MFTFILYFVAGTGLAVSFFKDKKKTKMSLKKAWKSFENILPQFLGVILIIGMMLSIFDNEVIMKFIGAESGIIGITISSIIGAITLIPGFVAFPLASVLFKSGAGIVQITAFVSSLMMVGIVTIPIEIKTFGKKATILRNLFSFVFSICAAIIMGVIY